MRTVIAAALALAALALAALAAVRRAACGGAADGGAGGGGFFRQYQYEEEVYLSLDGDGDGLRQRVTGRAQCPARHVVRHRAERAARSRGRARVLFDAGDAGRRADQRVAPEQPQVRPREARGRRHPPARRGGAVRVVDLRIHTRRRSVRLSAGDRARSREGRRATSGGPDGKSSRSGCICRARSGITTAGARTRGNILTWEQPLADRLRGTPLVLDARMDPQSILYRTLWLFGWTVVAVAITFVFVIWWIRRRAPAEKRAA